jgi:hypothetical protein
MSNLDQQQGSLERLGIPVETVVPEGVMTSGQARSVRFRNSRPQGYAYGDVESFIFDHIIPTLTWYSEELHQRDLAIHKLGEELDAAEVTIVNLQAQLDNKDFNDAVGRAVGDADRSVEEQQLMVRVKELEGRITELQNAPIASPDGEFYTREEVQSYIDSAVAEAEAHKDAEFSENKYYTEAQVQSILAEAVPAVNGYTQEQLDAAVNEAAVAATPAVPAEDVYTHEEVQGFIDTAVEEATATLEASKAAELAEAVAKAKQEAAANAAPSGYTQAQVDEQVATAVVQALATAAPTGYTQEQLEEAVLEAEARVKAELSSDDDSDYVKDLVNEGDLPLRAQIITLEKSLKDMTDYADELERYNETLTGATPAVHKEQRTDSYGRPLPEITAEDL